MTSLPRIGITLGDPAGVGGEVVVRAISDNRAKKSFVPIVIGDRSVLEDAFRICALNSDIQLIDDPSQAVACWDGIYCISPELLHKGDWSYGQVQKKCGEVSYRYIEKSIELALAGSIDAVVTGPVSKEAIQLSGHLFSGHTEVFAEHTGTQDYAMLLMSPALRVIHVTTHCSMLEACSRITKERVGTVIGLAHTFMHRLGVDRPSIGVAGFNPHSSENGLFGREEALEISPAIEEAKDLGLLIDGPISPDTIFVKALAGQYDIVIAMYHDQGHIPVKMSGFQTDAVTGRMTTVGGVNCTVGLPIIRTSVDHGTAFDIAGRGIADAQSMIDALQLALRLTENRDRTGK